jgi:hypothetical protein
MLDRLMHQKPYLNFGVLKRNAIEQKKYMKNACIFPVPKRENSFTVIIKLLKY